MPGDQPCSTGPGNTGPRKLPGGLGSHGFNPSRAGRLRLGTKLYTPDLLADLRDRTERSDGSSRIEIRDATSQVAVRQFAQEGSLVLLDFASARNPGGHFLGGAKAQEEDLCRCSGPYRTLLTLPAYYAIHREDRSLIYPDGIPCPRLRVRRSVNGRSRPTVEGAFAALGLASVVPSDLQDQTFGEDE